eukprot:7386237-Prymnesium_polylepis.1
MHDNGGYIGTQHHHRPLHVARRAEGPSPHSTLPAPPHVHEGRVVETQSTPTDPAPTPFIPPRGGDGPSGPRTHDGDGMGCEYVVHTYKITPPSCSLKS